MESASAGSTPISAKERLRLIRERHLGQTPERTSAERGEIAPEERQGTAPPLLEDSNNLAALQNSIAEKPEPVGILSPSLAFETAELLPKDILALDQNGQESLMPAMDLDPVTTFVQRPLQPPEAPERSLGFERSMAPQQTEPHEISNQSLQPLPDIQNVALSDLALVPEAAPTTLDPTTLTLSIEGDLDGSPSVATDDAGPLPLSHETPFGPLDSSRDETGPEADDDYPRDILLEIPTAPHEYVVTLPFFSSTRPQYNDIIRDHEQAIQQYTTCFSVTPHQQPNIGLIAKIDHMFSRLFDICDYPPFLDTLPSMTAEEITKHVVGTNPKMCFIYELLLALKEAGVGKNVVILARPGQITDMLTSVAQAGGHNLVSDGRWPRTADEASSSINIAILTTDGDLSAFSAKPDVYIVYDHTFDHGLIATQAADSPLVLVLTLVASIQHLNMRVSEKMEPLERKNFLVLAMAKAMRYIEEPDYLPGIDKPHEVAYEFAQHLQNSEYDDFHYEGQEIPDDVFQDLRQVSGSQALDTQQAADSGDATPARQSLKRTNNDYDDLASKRVRLSQPPLTGLMNHISEPLRELLGDDPTLDISDDSKVISVSVDRLETLSEMIIQLQDELRESRQRQEDFRKLSDRSKSEVDGYISSIKTIQTRYMEALKDRGTYEAECKKAQQEAEKLRSSLENSRQEASVWREKNHELTEKLKEANRSLETGENPDLARVSRLELEITEAREAVAKAERRATSANETAEYSKDVYQEASRTVLELRSENASLTQRLAELEGRASDNVVAVNQIQAQSEAKTLLRMVDEQKSIVRDREIELGRLREELRVKNGRRETRQSSVPRSPRILPGQGGAGSNNGGGGGGFGGAASSVLMSPARGHSRASGSGGITGASASSRGTSPVPPPMGVFDSSGLSAATGNNGGPLFNQVTGGGRFAHLRE
ncbi:uncharacterized protein B0I36DRAFT_109352 [Microdochium trichocladiopsis]|uniref:HDA1 complex subunit n=1 Tax=Microdochium trichocladiopsis TaxID=1682393 RepID=A0A9P8Y950_9PEZI|nr:uncharacterized protein B0I36DRAFT_109352 [Microdochium trichocladiopsis]KAH7033454.1 hypothetical protein B0I36DRAFT_109352 [Microdochium trichocladiopsis]